MSRYSPQVVPDAGPDWGSKIVDAARLAVELRRQSSQDERQKREDEQRARTADLDYYGKGGRTGSAPVEGTPSITVPDVPRFTPPTSDELADALRNGGGQPDLRATAPFVAPSTSRLGSVLSGGALGGGMTEQNGITGIPAGSGHVFGDGSDLGAPPTAGVGGYGALGGMGQSDETPRRDRAQTHAGAFDPATRSFGGSPLQMATAAQHAGAAPSPIASPGRTVALSNTNPRYVQLDDGHYVDTLHTPDAERDRDRESQLRLAAELRQGDIAARGTQATSLEEARQRGRLELRNSINASNIAGILQRTAGAAANSAAHDARVGANQAAHDKRVGSGPGGTGKPATAGQIEANARLAADGVIAESNGDYNAAIDWLQNTPEGQDAQAHGLAPRHLYTAMGKYRKLLSAEQLRLQAGSAMDTPEEAATAVEETHRRATTRSRPAGVTPPPAAGLDQDRADWDAAVAKYGREKVLKEYGPRP